MVKIFYKVLSPFRKFYWFIFRPKTYGVKTLIEFENKFLFIRNSYGIKHWTFPGGGKNRAESAEEGARREVLEETGISLPELIYLGEYKSTRQYKRDTVYCFYAKVNSVSYKIDPVEIEEVRWFAFDNIPSFRSKAVDEVLDLYKNIKSLRKQPPL
ncbi:MAG: ADP-ribose pyrophosphatase [Candidatus Giovannonibacteria bacterium GW2011_GWA2_44_13b]|uniref:ADP-ribose pyrophosphatase n=2 Tax=Candidatus Giovannoniibacteriota TaxID=1752738 RepID=A0A0G1H699_9BACT|nr:MAG: ADP-ribose pyrophosphatase [Candidatus Giovannonibacteria bacterium GW2011_GWA2_44_13b]OGF83220.1 MAG: hypothetical protein A2924_02800 [Candidatus Giovannonibacteria bacterium RIFCSPLOWO2_01_FULL_44_16]